MTKLVPVIKTATHCSASGQTLKATPEICDDLVAISNKGVHHAPFCYGHPKDNLPAAAWADSLVFNRNTSTVSAETEVVDEALMQNLEGGANQYPSIGYCRLYARR
jgi:hypothetical protein